MEPDYIKQKALIRILDDDEALGAALKLYLELDGWQVAAYTPRLAAFLPKIVRLCPAASCLTCVCPN